jgi:hypothetical protein
MVNIKVYADIALVLSASFSASIGMIYFGFKHYFKNGRKQMNIREHKSAIPEGWYGNLIRLIIKNSQKAIENKGFSNIYEWKKGNFILTCKELLNTNDQDENIYNFDIPVISTFIVTIEQKRRVMPKLLTYFSLDRGRHHFPSTDFSFNENFEMGDFKKDYLERLQKTPNIYVKGRKVL